MNHGRYDIGQHRAQHDLGKAALKGVVNENGVCYHDDDRTEHHQNSPPALISIVSPQNDVADATDQKYPQKLPDHQRFYTVFLRINMSNR